MKGSNAHGHVTVFRILKPGRFYHPKESFLIWEIADRFDKVLIAVAIIGNHVAHLRNHIKAIKVVGFLHHRVR